MTHQSANVVIMKIHKISSFLPYTHLSIGDRAAALGPFRCIDKGLRQPHAKFHIVVAASPLPTSWWLLSLSAGFTGAITEVAKTAWPASRVHYPSWSYRVNEGSLGTSCHGKVGSVLQNQRASNGKKIHTRFNLNSPMLIISPKTDEEFVVEQFQRSFSNCLWHSVIPRFAPRLRDGMRSGLDWQTLICCEDKPGTP